MPLRYFTTDKSSINIRPVVITEISKDEIDQLKDNILWIVDTNIFPEMSTEEMKSYFQEVVESPENTLTLSGFDTEIIKVT